MRQVLACGSSDGAISVLCYGSNNQWEAEKINNAHTIGIKIVHSFTTPAPVVFEELLTFESPIGCNSVSWAPGLGAGIKRF